MKKEKQDIIFWQETHLSNIEHEKLKKLGYKNTYYSSFEGGNTRGVAILISNRLNFKFSSQIKDKEGCYILVKGFIDHKEVTLVNVYRPPASTKHLIKRIFDLLSVDSSGVLICGGDWNAQLQPSLDSSNKTKKICSEAIYIRKLMKETGTVDVWRELHPVEKRFTFFSHPHLVYSRIDYFFMFGTDRHRVIKSDIGVRDISDHAGVYLAVHLDNKPKETLWRLNTSLLNDTQCQKYVKEEFKEYIAYNDNGTVSPSTLWDAAKAVLRGKLIQWSSRKKREKDEQIKVLSEKLKELESKHVENSESNILKVIINTKKNLK